MESLKNSDLISQLCQISRSGETGGACSDNCHLVTVRSRYLRIRLLISHMICAETFKTAYTHRLTFYASYALALALPFLGANSSADSGERIGRFDNAVGALEIAFGYFSYEFRYPNTYGASCHTGTVFAVKAALGFVDSLFCSITVGDLLEVPGSDKWLLLGHRCFLRIHIGHYLTPPVSLQICLASCSL